MIFPTRLWEDNPGFIGAGEGNRTLVISLEDLIASHAEASKKAHEHCKLLRLHLSHKPNDGMMGQEKAERVVP